MPVMSNSLIANGGAFAPSPDGYIANLQDSGQLAFGPLLPNIDGNTPPVFLPMQLFVLHVPTVFNYIPNGTQIFKAIFETHLQSMDGIDIAYAMDVEGTNVGRDGQQMMVPTRQTRSQITPTCTWSEKIGNAIWNFGRLWFNIMHDPDTQAATMAAILQGTSTGSTTSTASTSGSLSAATIPPLVASMYTADIMLVQYSSDYQPQNIMDAVALTNFFPSDIGATQYHLNPTESHKIDRTFTFQCLVQHNANTIAVARSLALAANLHTVNYQDATPIAQSIDSQLSGEGLDYLTSTYLNNFQNLNGTVG